MVITVKAATAASQQRWQSICRCERKLLQELLNELPLLWMACVELAYSSLTQSVQDSVYRCFQDLEKLRKAQKNAWTFWKARFIGYLHMRVTSAVSSASETSTTSTKRSASDSPLASSTPRSRLPTQKRPAVVRTDRYARIIPMARDPGDKRCHCIDSN